MVEGLRLTVDVFEVWIVHGVQDSSSAEEKIEIVDLTSEATGVATPEATGVVTAGRSPTPPGDGRRIGGRFWALLNCGDDDADGEAGNLDENWRWPTGRLQWQVIS